MRRFAGGFALALAAAACGAPPSDVFEIKAISSDSQESVPCAIYVDGARRDDPAGHPVATPAAIPISFGSDSSGGSDGAGVKVSVFPLVSVDGKWKLPTEGTGDPAPGFRVDRRAERTVHRSDSRTQLFILVPNGDGRWYDPPSSAASGSTGN